MLLSAALIVRDEAGSLDACLNSLDGLVDEIVVVDTGSADESVAIAERHGAVIAHEPWRDDFSAPRNRSLELASGEWILYVDADERVRYGDHAVARERLSRDTQLLAGLIPFVPRVGWTPYREYRLWRNRDDVRFRGAMHESIVPAITAAAERDSLSIEGFDLITIEHFGYEGDQSAKRARDEPMLLAEIERLPERSYLYDHLARVYEAMGESERAVAAWQRGIEVARARGRSHPDDRLVYVNLIFHLLARGSIDEEVAALVYEALDSFPGIPSLELAAARYEFATGRVPQAAGRAEWLVRLDLDAVIDTGSSYDPRVFGEWAWDLLGLCQFSLGDHASAAQSFRNAEVAAPGAPVYAARRRLAEARATTA